jgi:sterol desaturase/sphingolipid hydroxylase (fatty acid hydroxylase superfamily)
MMPSAELLLMMIVSCTVFTGVVILNVIGYSKLATQDPRYRGIERSWWPRGMVRVSASVLAAVLLACMLVQSTSMWELLHKTLGVQAMHGWIAVLVMMVIHNVVVMSYMAKLAMRIPEPMLARTAVLYRPVLAGVAIVPCGLGIVIAMVMYGRLLYRLFKEVARVRRAIGDGAYVDRSLAE